MARILEIMVFSILAIASTSWAHYHSGYNHYRSGLPVRPYQYVPRRVVFPARYIRQHYPHGPRPFPGFQGPQPGTPAPTQAVNASTDDSLNSTDSTTSTAPTMQSTELSTSTPGLDARAGPVNIENMSSEQLVAYISARVEHALRSALAPMAALLDEKKKLKNPRSSDGYSGTTTFPVGLTAQDDMEDANRTARFFVKGISDNTKSNLATLLHRKLFPFSAVHRQGEGVPLQATPANVSTADSSSAVADGSARISTPASGPDSPAATS
ncbi:uncharacterized protein LOC135399975 [Ornithodoros turicata]|uniref:uncharacterized protein LOC135399975 n=1 Tax=Ornithodoros turicata TaxID=34597 RepID=UPI0031390B7F